MINLILASKRSTNLNVLRLLLPLYKRPQVICTALPQGTHHPVTWIQRKSHRFGQSAHVDWGKIEQDPAGLVLTLKTWALYSVRCPGRRPSILMSHSHRHRNKKEGGWIYILSRSIKQWIVNNLFHAIKIKIACCLVSWVILCDNERYVMCSN